MADSLDMNVVNKMYFNTCVGVAYNMTKDRDLSKDIAQETIIKVWLKQKTYNPEKASFFTWIYKIVRNTANDHLRRINRVDFIRSDNEEIWYNFVCPCINTDTLDLEMNLNKIQIKYRFCVYQSFIIGMTRMQISKKFNMTPGEVANNVRYGLKELRKIYT